ncbi:Facilitated trehalose transporter Tret1 [Eumeta japonica]|uniref:Facilitated trehalose transporter Tret1 n=1 Tax=Eumeta variegata TaxID=151549 RepID=A0A4C1TXE1_EUMVA|nr:Facilitated trehalose transporter Tret1 [Eumeta japonica]
MDIFKHSPLVNQVFVVSGVFYTILSCGLGLGFLSAVLNKQTPIEIKPLVEDDAIHCIEIAGEMAFVPSLVIIPFIMQCKGRRIATLAAVLPLLLFWIVSYVAAGYCFLLLNILHGMSMAGTVAVSSVSVAEFCTPKYRGPLLVLETAMLSLGILASHVCAAYLQWRVLSTLGIITTVFGAIIVYYWPESPFWLISQGHVEKCTECFYWLRGQNQDSRRELDALISAHNVVMQTEVLRPIRKIHFKEKISILAKSLFKRDFLRPFSVMILLFSFIGLGGENSLSSYSLRDVFSMTNGKYIGTIILDIITFICSLISCVLVQLVKRKTLFIFTGSFSVLFLGLSSVFLFLQALGMLSSDYLWLFLTFVTGFAMFMSLGTTALPYTLLGEIFPMSYRGIGSSITCAYLWAFGNTVLKLVPQLSSLMGVPGMLMLFVGFMTIALVVLSKIMPETKDKTLLEIENLMKYNMSLNENDYEAVSVSEKDDVIGEALGPSPTASSTVHRIDNSISICRKWKTPRAGIPAGASYQFPARRRTNDLIRRADRVRFAGQSDEISLTPGESAPALRVRKLEGKNANYVFPLCFDRGDVLR